MKTPFDYAEQFTAMQKQMMDFWGDAVKKGSTQESTSGKGFDAMFQAGEQIVQQWQQAVEAFQKGMQNAVAEKAGEQFYRQWLQQQEEISEEWKQIYTKLQAQAGKPEYVQTLWTVMNDVTHSYLKRQEQATLAAAAATPWLASMNGTVPKTVQNAYKHIHESIDSYSRLYELWKPLAEAMKSQSWSQEEISAKMQEWFAPEKYKSVLDNLFSFMSPEQTRRYQEQMQTMMETFQASFKKASEGATSGQQDLSELWQKMAQGDFASVSQWYNTMYRKAEEAASPMRFMPPMYGNVPEVNEILADIVKTAGEYNIEYARFRYHYYTTGQKAFEELLTSATEHVKKGELPPFDEFFKQWVQFNEARFTDLFQTKEYATLQGSLLEKGLHLRMSMQKLMEQGLKDYPVALRSELDEAYKSIQELTRTVRSLEREVKALRKEAAEAQAEKATKTPAETKTKAAKA